MTIFERLPFRVHAFQVPAFGEVASEPVPDWLVRRMGTGEVYLNKSGGLSANYVWGTRGCAPGDFIMLNEDDEVDFCTSDAFDLRFKEVPPAP